jgi:chromosome transmission fidelity protein 18
MASPLQFIKSKSGEVNEKMIRSSTVGLKDSGTSLNAMWNSLFVPLSAKKRRQTQGIAEGKYVNRLAFDIQACGEYDKVVQGGFLERQCEVGAKKSQVG